MSNLGNFFYSVRDLHAYECINNNIINMLSLTSSVIFTQRKDSIFNAGHNKLLFVLHLHGIDNMSHVMKKTCLCHMQTTKVQIACAYAQSD